jgi:glutathione synthase/RimK-type ligase-like ATP-grasp enzyme
MSNLQPSRRGRRPSVVVVATVHWASTTRLCLSLAEGGFEVVALAPDDHALHGLSGIVVRSIGRTRAHGLSEIIRTVESRPPDLLVPADERAIDFMRILYRRAIGGKGRNAGQMAALIEASLGSPSAFVFAAQKSRLVSLAQREGLLVPATNVVDDILELRRLVARAQFPLVLKQDGSSGGQGVRIVSNAADAEQSFVELRTSAGPRAAVKTALKKLDLSYLDGLYRKRPAISLQEYIVGRPANRAVVCHRGEVLAGLSVEALQTTDATGPATVIRVINSPEMSDAGARMVRHLGLSGFVGFDFMLEAATGRAYLIEMNGRPTQICHLALDADSDMIGALAARLPTVALRRTIPNIDGPTVALFPQESWRDPNSGYLTSAFHDIPRHVPEFIAAYCSPVGPEPPDWVQIMRRYAREPRRILRGTTMSPGLVANLNASVGQADTARLVRKEM